MKFLTPLLAVIAIVSIISNVLIYERFNTRKPVITVGSQPISRFEYEAATEKASGMPVLKKIVYSDLVLQAAKKAGVMPTKAEVDARLADLEAKSPQVSQQVAANPDTVTDLTTQMALENLQIQGVTASDAEIQAYYNRNKAQFSKPSQVQTTMVISQNKADSGKAEQLLRQNVSPEGIASQPGLRVAGVGGTNVNLGGLAPALRQEIGKTVLSMKVGQIRTVPVGNFFLTFKAKSTQATEVPPLAKIKDQVARAVKLQKAISPQEEILALYKSNPPVFNNPKYADFFKDVQTAEAQEKTASAK